MITDCNHDNVNQVFEYIGDDYQNCLYTYIDLCKYGLDNENFKVWIQYDDDNNICCIISEYYGGFQLYSKSYNLMADELIDFLKQEEAQGISARKQSIDLIEEAFPDYHKTTGIIGKLTELSYPPNADAYSAPLEEMEEISRIVSQNENLSKHHSYESIYKQFCERKMDNFGRNFVLRNPENGEIICHAATYAETGNLGVIGGVLTTDNYRGKGYSKGTLAAICNELLSENKTVFSKFIIPPAIKMHYGVGFEKVGDWITLKKMSWTQKYFKKKK